MSPLTEALLIVLPSVCWVANFPLFWTAPSLSCGTSAAHVTRSDSPGFLTPTFHHVRAFSLLYTKASFIIPPLLPSCPSVRRTLSSPVSQPRPSDPIPSYGTGLKVFVILLSVWIACMVSDFLPFDLLLLLQLSYHFRRLCSRYTPRSSFLIFFSDAVS